MVRFVDITIVFQNGTSYKGRSVDELIEYQNSCWVELSYLLQTQYLRKRASHHDAERNWEHRYLLPLGSLHGVCFLFGGVLATNAKIAIPEVREILLHAKTEIRVEVNEAARTVYVLICDGRASWLPGGFLFSYPISETLIPQFDETNSESSSE